LQYTWLLKLGLIRNRRPCGNDKIRFIIRRGRGSLSVDENRNAGKYYQENNTTHELDFYTNIFFFRKKLQRFKTAFAAEAAVFHAAERGSQVAEQPAVYPDYS